jgi:hypothetical protein
MGEWMYRSTFSWLALAGGEWSASRPGHFTPIGQEAGWASWASFDDLEKGKFLTLPGLDIWPLRRSALSQSLYRLSYPGSWVKRGKMIMEKSRTQRSSSGQHWLTRRSKLQHLKAAPGNSALSKATYGFCNFSSSLYKIDCRSLSWIDLYAICKARFECTSTVNELWNLQMCVNLCIF